MGMKALSKTDFAAVKNQTTIEIRGNKSVNRHVNTALNKLKAYFEKPSDATVEAILKYLALSKCDDGYGRFKEELRAMIGRKAREGLFLEFFKRLSNNLAGKIREELVRRERELGERVEERCRELIRRYEWEISRSRGEIVEEIVPKVLKVISDQTACSILRALNEGDKRIEELKSSLGLKNDDLAWRIGALMDLALISPSNCGRGDKYSITNLGRAVVEEMENLEERIYTINHIKRLIALKAVGDKSGSERLLAVIDNGRMRGHENYIRKIMEDVNDDVRRLSQALLERREMSVKHAKHLLPSGVKIIDHEELGRLLVLECWLRDLIGFRSG
jgi:DNA-binding HxlR family transcriptional regulator